MAFTASSNVSVIIEAFPPNMSEHPLADTASQLPDVDGPLEGARFTPGTVVGGRYRIVALLGVGGMGEVYRADDLKLGQPVALKFLPGAVRDDPVRRAALLDEVRMARQVAHPNVCRVWDVSDLDGQLFLSMEYVDGEDLGSLLRRIGRLPAGKALDIARQVAAALGAAHARGILHRDLKPSNIMLDGRGRVRVMDFGLALPADDPRRGRDLSGTPAYMAPEQLAGLGASVRSDIFAFGLVLYELYTGRRAFPAATLHELRSRLDGEPPVPPSALVRDMDGAVERVILRALSRDPSHRPARVVEIAAELPGGDVLEAALRAGETPSPALIAAAGETDGLEPARAWALVALAVLGAVVAATLSPRALVWSRASLQKPPEALAETARDLLHGAGHGGVAADRASGFETDVDHLRYLRQHDRSRSRWEGADPSYLRFWYREAPTPLESLRFPFSYGGLARVGPGEPPLDVTGMSRVRLDPAGRLSQLVVVPPTRGDPALPPDWTALLSAAGLDRTTLMVASPRFTPPVPTDSRAAWEGSWPASPELRVHVEAGSFGGRPVYFEVFHPWTRPAHSVRHVLTGTQGLAVAIVLLVGFALIGVAAVLARRNLRAGRGDRRGAWRVSAFVFASILASWFFGEHHVPTLWEVALVVMALSWALLAAAVCWVVYLAAEPAVRRHFPGVMVGWTRLLRGQLRDPVVGRDVLVGCAAGPWMIAGGFVEVLLPGWLGLAPDILPADVIGIAYGVQRVIPLLVWRGGQAVVVALASVFLLLVLRLALGSSSRAAVAWVLVISVPLALASEHPGLGFATGAFLNALFVLLLLRGGVLAVAVTFYTWGLFILFPLTADLSAWYAGGGVAALLVLALLGVYGFLAALGGRSPLGSTAGEDN